MAQQKGIRESKKSHTTKNQLTFLSTDINNPGEFQVLEEINRNGYLIKKNVKASEDKVTK